MTEQEQSNKEQNTVGDKDTALGLLRDSRTRIVSLARTAGETSDPLLKRLGDEALTKAVAEHFSLTGILIRKGWFPYHDSGRPLQSDKVTQERQISQVKLPAAGTEEEGQG